MSVFSPVQGTQYRFDAAASALGRGLEAPPSSSAPGVSGVRPGRTVVLRAVGSEQPIDAVTFSPEALEAATRIEQDATAQANPKTRPQDGSAGGRAVGDETTAADQAEVTDEPSDAEGEEDTAARRGADGEPLSDEEVEQVRELEARDLEVRRHEQAHVAAGGAYVTSGPNYQYQQGPDGKRYAVGGSVGIDVSSEDTPEKTIAKAQVVRQAALAPAEPSAQDVRVAAQASQLEQQARAELSEQRREETPSRGESTEAGTDEQLFGTTSVIESR